MKIKYLPDLPDTNLEISTLFFITACTVFGVFISHIDMIWYEQVYVGEDGFIEWLTVLALLGLSATMFYRFFRLRNQKPKLLLAILFFTGLLGIFGAGEEISWGQRIFQVESSEFFLENNSQQETNLHNMVVNGKKVNKVIFSQLLFVGIMIYLLILPVAYQKSVAIQKFIDQVVGVTVPRFYQVLFFMMFMGLGSMIDSGKKAELIEFSSCMMFLIIALYPRNKVIFSPKIEKSPIKTVPDLVARYKVLQQQ